MSTKPLSRPSREIKCRYLSHRMVDHPVKPDPTAWFMFLCDRCEEPFRIQGRIVRCCMHCRDTAIMVGIWGSNVIGEASGA